MAFTSSSSRRRSPCLSLLPAAALLALAVGCKTKSEPPPAPAPAPAADPPPPRPRPRCASPTATGRAGPPGRSPSRRAGSRRRASRSSSPGSTTCRRWTPTRAGKVDAVTVTNGDALVTGANGAKSKMILVNDYSNGNDQIIGRPQGQDVQGPEGQEGRPRADPGRAPAVPEGLEKFGMKPADVELVNFPTNETPQALASGQVSAIGAWYPVVGPGAQGGRRDRRRCSPAPTSPA